MPKGWILLRLNKNAMKRQMIDSEKADFFSQMNTLLDAGLDLAGVFGIILEECRDERMNRMLEYLYDDVLTGSSLADAMRRCDRFSDMDCGVVGVGEISGRLPQTLAFLSDYYSSRDAHTRMIRSSLAYPLMILGFAVAVLAFMLLVIVPVFGDIYSRMGGELPNITRGMLAMSKHAPAVFGCVASLCAAVWIVYARNRGTEHFEQVRCRVLLSLPLVGSIVMTDAQCTFCRLMSLLTASGVSMMESLAMAGRSMGLIAYRNAFASVADAVRNGGSLAGAMSDWRELFDTRILTMVRIGEEGNRLPNMFEKAADICSARLEDSFKRLQTWLEPVMIVFVGIIVTLVLVSMYLPMFRMGSTILGG